MIHVLRVPTHEVARRDDGERWCFVCRKRREFTRIIRAPVDPMSYYGPHLTVQCEFGHVDGDVFPGRVREWVGDG